MSSPSHTATRASGLNTTGGCDGGSMILHSHPATLCPRLVLKVLSHDECGKELIVLFDPEFGLAVGGGINRVASSAQQQPGTGTPPPSLAAQQQTLWAVHAASPPAPVSAVVAVSHHSGNTRALVERVTNAVGGGGRRATAAAAMLTGTKQHLVLPAATTVTVRELQEALFNQREAPLPTSESPQRIAAAGSLPTAPQLTRIPIERQMLRFEGQTISGAGSSNSVAVNNVTVADALRVLQGAGADSIVHRTVHLYDGGALQGDALRQHATTSLDVGAVLTAPRWVPPIFEAARIASHVQPASTPAATATTSASTSNPNANPSSVPQNAAAQLNFLPESATYISPQNTAAAAAAAPPPAPSLPQSARRGESSPSSSSRLQAQARAAAFAHEESMAVAVALSERARAQALADINHYVALEQQQQQQQASGAAQLRRELDELKAQQARQLALMQAQGQITQHRDVPVGWQQVVDSPQRVRQQQPESQRETATSPILGVPLQHIQRVVMAPPLPPDLYGHEGYSAAAASDAQRYIVQRRVVGVVPSLEPHALHSVRHSPPGVIAPPPQRHVHTTFHPVFAGSRNGSQLRGALDSTVAMPPLVPGSRSGSEHYFQYPVAASASARQPPTTASYATLYASRDGSHTRGASPAADPIVLNRFTYSPGPASRHASTEHLSRLMSAVRNDITTAP